MNVSYNVYLMYAVGLMAHVSVTDSVPKCSKKDLYRIM